MLPLLLLPFLLSLLPPAHPLPADPTTTFTDPTDLPSFIVPSMSPPPNSTTNAPDGSSCTRSLWHGTWSYAITIHNKTTPERSALGTGFYDNVNADCRGLNWPANPTPLAQVGGRVTDYYVWIEVGGWGGDDDGGCVENAVWQAERKRVICRTVPSPCSPSASECSV